ncbi:MAG: 1-acyl-sn-glycerol-3-phosphate acyltransferase [Rhodobacteraceae bacterium]|nr:1-acyl-sn-glycerol-3-phosphate acyltransferase [Paracoccaceae bacterium]
MIFLRSTLFQILFYGLTFFYMLALSPMLLLPRRWGVWIIPFWGVSCLVLMRLTVGLKVEFRGKENIPEGGFIVASKHQSSWETFALIPLFQDPTYIMKQELRWWPLFGWYITKFRQIPINRGKRSVALAAMGKAAAEAIDENREILIFPEGTRRKPGAEPKYKYGVLHLYNQLQCPVLPIGLNSGLYWPRSSWIVYPGTVLVEILPPIMPGLGTDEFRNVMVEQIETSTARLVEEARVSDNPPPTVKWLDVPAES